MIRLSLRHWLLGALFCASQVGCGHSLSQGARSGLANQPVSTIEMEPLQLEVSRGSTGPQIEAYDAPTLFEEGGEHMDADHYTEAAASYERLIANFPDSPYLPPAIFNAGLSYEGLGRYADAADRYRQVSERFGDSKVAKDATLRLGACYAELGRWPASIEIFERALGRTDLDLGERIESMSRRSLALLEIGDQNVAERGFLDAVAYYQTHKDEERISSGFFVAMAQFYTANIAHRRFRTLPLRLPQKQLTEDIQTLSRQFLATQERYVAAIKYKDPTWASAAGFHVGALYRELYDALIKAPLPPELDNELKKLIYGEMLKGQLRNLLEKARAILEKNVEMAGRVGLKNGWIEKSGEEIDELGKLLAALDAQEVGPAATTPTGERRPSAPELPSAPKPHPRKEAAPSSLM